MRTKEIILSYLDADTARRLASIDGETFGQITELRLRTDKPLFVYARAMEYILADDGLRPSGLSSVSSFDHAYCPTATHIAETLERVSRYSLYAFEEELRAGYITLPGGHRVGVTGRVVNGERAIRNINALNIRIAHQVKGCADPVLPFLLASGTGRLLHTMILSPPGGGKTTLLRDLVRQLSDGKPGIRRGMTVGVADERSEIAGCYRGIPQNDVGCRTDVLDACPKAEGMVMLLRAMKPDVIAVDELGGERDARAVEDALNAGVHLLCTAHAKDWNDLRQKPALAKLWDKRVFERFVLLHAPGHAEVYDAEGSVVFDGTPTVPGQAGEIKGITSAPKPEAYLSVPLKTEVGLC